MAESGVIGVCVMCSEPRAYDAGRLTTQEFNFTHFYGDGCLIL